jgi:hypothetical protein
LPVRDYSRLTGTSNGYSDHFTCLKQEQALHVSSFAACITDCIASLTATGCNHVVSGLGYGKVLKYIPLKGESLRVLRTGLPCKQQNQRAHE